MGLWALGFEGLALATLVGVPLYAYRVRGRSYAIFALVVLAISLPGTVILRARFGALFPGAATWIDAAFFYAMLAAAIHLLGLLRARLRPAYFRVLVSIPGMAFVAGGALAGAWLAALLPVRGALAVLGLDHALLALRWVDLVPVGIVAASLVTSTRLISEVVRVPLATDGPEQLTRVPVERYRRRRTPAPLAERPLRIVQVADPHIGPWQPVAKLRRRIEELIAHEPDLVLLTGDFLTMEGVGTPGALAEALSPLRSMPGRCFAIFGNHDHESPVEVEAGLRAAGVHLLIDEETIVHTPVGPVQILGADYRGRDRREHLETFLSAYPRREAHLRLLLLHDPSAFKHVPKGDVDLTLSGHTHGGQLGLLSFGFDWTVLHRTAWPDHGLFAHGSNRLYVHRGTGFYGFPLRIGVPGEASRLEVMWNGLAPVGDPDPA